MMEREGDSTLGGRTGRVKGFEDPPKPLRALPRPAWESNRSRRRLLRLARDGGNRGINKLTGCE